MRDRIIVDKGLIPYRFNIALPLENFEMFFMYNEAADLFTCTLSKNGEVLVYDEPLIYGKSLFSDVYKSGVFPMIDIVPLDEAGETDVITYDNFGKTVFLTIDNGENL